MFEEVEINSIRWFDLKDLLHEEWKPIKGYELLYMISDYGRVKSLEKKSITTNKTYPTKILKCHINTKKYLDVDLCKNGKSHRQRIHRLVAQAFIPNPENKPQINQYNLNGDFIKTWDSITRIKDEKGYSDGFISQCCKGKYKQAYGYVWKYKEVS